MTLFNGTILLNKIYLNNLNHILLKDSAEAFIIFFTLLHENTHVLSIDYLEKIIIILKILGNLLNILKKTKKKKKAINILELKFYLTL